MKLEASVLLFMAAGCTGGGMENVENVVPDVTSGEAASGVLGHDHFETGEEEGPSAAHVNRPRGLAVLDGRLFVSQAYWNRVTAFDLTP